ncbi:MAG TPA: TIGR00730 family Rossman fold protein [Microbacterium sp.]|uniref:LOG family protein n=1 Tax=Microbacterium sp. TaxID=51671 RepID=UPI002B4A01A2|nr:TIGR00730 family Rossman fold protein [Microbacterium sp.]HKT56032.1 TIGR00730 family Rossman fold protein [Microbacterium sp.]
MIDDEEFDRLIADAEIPANRSLIRRILRAGIELGTDRTTRLDLKITAAAIEEMRDAFRLYAPYADIPKVTVFGSARTQPGTPLYTQARDIAASLAAQGWMVVTGAGPGIMQAATEGAGPGRSVGISIRLPFEEKPNEAVADERHVSMKYFFTRKLMLMKESRGFVSLPGGFGTLDETFELLTLQQTGKAEPMPIVLLDRPGGTFWTGLADYVEEELAGSGTIAPDDMQRVLVTDSVVEAAAHVEGFWRNYDSLRWVGDRLVLRLKHAPTDAEVASLNREFAGLLATGFIEASGPLPVETSDHDKTDLPRLVLNLNQYKVGELYQLIGAVNALGTARA